MWKRLYSNSGLIALALLAAGIWFSNALDFFPISNTPNRSDFDPVLVASPSPTPTPVTIEAILSATARCKDGTFSHSSSKQQ